MASYLLLSDKLNSFLAALDRFQVWAPVSKNGSCVFEPVSGRLDSVEIDVHHQPLPAKKAVFPQTEPFFSFGREGVRYAMEEMSEPRILVLNLTK